MVLISVEGVGKYFSDLPVLSDVTFDVRAGDHIALVGPNGCGKTTLLNILSGQLEPDRGQLNRDQSVRIGFLKQQGHFSPGLTVWDQARDALRDLFALVAEAEQAADALGTELDPIQRQRLEQRYDQLQDRLFLCFIEIDAAVGDPGEERLQDRVHVPGNSGDSRVQGRYRLAVDGG